MRGVILTTAQVQGILDGRVTMFRVPIKPQTVTHSTLEGLTIESIDDFMTRNRKDAELLCAVCAPCKPGEILYVRETWRDRWGMAYANYGTGSAYPIDDVREIEYKAGGNGFFMRGCNLCPDEPTVKWGAWSKWRSPATMPREAARLFLRVMETRVEQVQEIDVPGIVAEGQYDDCADCLNCYSQSGTQCCVGADDVCGQYDELRFEYERYWNARFAKRGLGWDKNPWTWVTQFEQAKGASHDTGADRAGVADLSGENSAAGGTADAGGGDRA